MGPASAREVASARSSTTSAAGRPRRSGMKRFTGSPDTARRREVVAERSLARSEGESRRRRTIKSGTMRADHEIQGPGARRDPWPSHRRSRMRIDLVDSFFGLSLFQQLGLIFLTGPLVASVWVLVADHKRSRRATAVPVAPRVAEERKAA